MSTLQLLGKFIMYSLRDDFDIEHRLAQALLAMGSLQHFWADNTVNVRSKYLIFYAITVNLALWGCKTWALHETLLKNLKVFFHRSIRRILGISITQLIDEHITNDSVHMRFLPYYIDTTPDRQTTASLYWKGFPELRQPNPYPSPHCVVRPPPPSRCAAAEQQEEFSKKYSTYFPLCRQRRPVVILGVLRPQQFLLETSRFPARQTAYRMGSRDYPCDR